jgi:hypothetical protein
MPLAPVSASVTGLDVGRLFPLISPAPAPPAGIGQAFPVITPSAPPATPAPAPGSGQAPPRARTTGRDLALSEQLPGSRQVGLIFALLIVAGAATWLLLGRARRRRPALSLAHAGQSGPAASPPGVAPPMQPQAGPARDAGPLPPVSTPPPPAVTPVPPVAAPPPPASFPAGRAAGPDGDLAPREPLARGRQAGLVFTLLAAAGAVAWLLARARKRRVP